MITKILSSNQTNTGLIGIDGRNADSKRELYISDIPTDRNTIVFRLQNVHTHTITLDKTNGIDILFPKGLFDDVSKFVLTEFEKDEKISSETFAEVEVVNDNFSRSNWMYKVKRKKNAPFYEYLDVAGKTILNEAVETVRQYNDVIPFLLVLKDKKFGFVNSYGRSAFVYDKVKLPIYDDQISQDAYACKKGKHEVLYIPGNVHKEFFDKDQYDKIENLTFYEGEEYSFYWLFLVYGRL